MPDQKLSALADIRLDEDYDRFYAAQVASGKKLPPPLDNRTLYQELPQYQGLPGAGAAAAAGQISPELAQHLLQQQAARAASASPAPPPNGILAAAGAGAGRGGAGAGGWLGGDGCWAGPCSAVEKEEGESALKEGLRCLAGSHFAMRIQGCNRAHAH